MEQPKAQIKPDHPEQPLSPEVPRLILADNPEPVIETLAKIEGQGWADRQRRLLVDADAKDESGTWAIKGAVQALKSVQQDLAALRQELVTETDPAERLLIAEEIDDLVKGRKNKAIIYGAGGFNRHFVRSDGSIAIGREFMIGIKQKETSELAQALGIEII